VETQPQKGEHQPDRHEGEVEEDDCRRVGPVAAHQCRGKREEDDQQQRGGVDPGDPFIVPGSQPEQAAVLLPEGRDDEEGDPVTEELPLLACQCGPEFIC
jgi:hypothetical protein